MVCELKYGTCQEVIAKDNFSVNSLAATLAQSMTNSNNGRTAATICC